MSYESECVIFDDESKNILIQNENGEWAYKCFTKKDILEIEEWK